MRLEIPLNRWVFLFTASTEEVALIKVAFESWSKSSGFVSQAAVFPHSDAVAQTWEDGPYMFLLSIEDLNKNRPADAAWSLQSQCAPPPHTREKPPHGSVH